MPQWYYDKKELKNTPSCNNGLDPDTETRYRREGARFIQEVGKTLGLRHDTMATASVYFHRFYMFHSFFEFPRYVTATCTLFLSGKAEETPKKCRDLIKTVRGLTNDHQFGQFGGDPREEVMTLERVLLQTIKFDLQVDHPYSSILKYAKSLKGDKPKLQKMVQMSWTFVNDSLCTTLCLQWEPEVIAIALMYLASKLSKFEVKDWKNRTPEQRYWWDQYVKDLDTEVLEDICHQVLDLYSQPTTETKLAPASPTPTPGARPTKPPPTPAPPPTSAQPTPPPPHPPAPPSKPPLPPSKPAPPPAQPPGPGFPVSFPGTVYPAGYPAYVVPANGPASAVPAGYQYPVQTQAPAPSYASVAAIPPPSQSQTFTPPPSQLPPGHPPPLHNQPSRSHPPHPDYRGGSHPPDHRGGPPPDHRGGPPPDHRGGPPDHRGPPPPDHHRSHPPSSNHRSHHGSRGPPNDGYRGRSNHGPPPHHGHRGPPPRGPPSNDGYRGPPPHRNSPYNRPPRSRGGYHGGRY